MKTNMPDEIKRPLPARVGPERLAREYAWRADESPSALQFNRLAMAQLDDVLPNTHNMVMLILGQLGEQARRVWFGKTERTAAGIEEWETYITVDELVEYAKPTIVTRGEAIFWLRYVTTAMQGMGTVADSAVANGGSYYFVEPLWWIKAAVHRSDSEGMLPTEPDGFVLVPGHYFRSIVREAGNM